MTSIIAIDAEVRAYLDGKTMSLVLCKPQPDYVDVSPQGTVASINYKVGVPLALCPYSIGQPIHVKEAWGIDPHDTGRDFVTYRVKSGIVDYYWGWLSPVVMPQEYSRITLTPTAIRLIRVQEVTEGEAIKCGLGEICDNHKNPAIPGVTGACENCMDTGFSYPPLFDLQEYWDARYATKPRPVRRGGKIVGHVSYPWASNPFVWLIEHTVEVR